MTCRSLNKLDFQILFLYSLCRGLGMLGNFNPLHCPFAQHIYVISSIVYFESAQCPLLALSSFVGQNLSNHRSDLTPSARPPLHYCTLIVPSNRNGSCCGVYLFVRRCRPLQCLHCAFDILVCELLIPPDALEPRHYVGYVQGGHRAGHGGDWRRGRCDHTWRVGRGIRLLLLLRYIPATVFARRAADAQEPGPVSFPLAPALPNLHWRPIQCTLHKPCIGLRYEAWFPNLSMREMGIKDESLARKALTEMGGDLQAAIDLIFSGWLG